MTEPTLAVQRALRARLIANAAVTALVPVANVGLDDRRPDAMPCVLFGPANCTFMDRFEQFFDEVFADIHIWTAEPGLSSVKEIAGAIRSALDTGAIQAEGYRVINSKLASARYLRDPDGVHAHGVLSIEAILQATS